MIAKGKKKRRQELDQELVKDCFVIAVRGQLYMKTETAIQKSTSNQMNQRGFLCEKSKYH